jgi:hypothetical protein
VAEVEQRLKQAKQSGVYTGDFTLIEEQLAKEKNDLKEAREIAEKFRQVPRFYRDAKITPIAVEIKPDGTMEPSTIELTSRRTGGGNNSQSQE